MTSTKSTGYAYFYIADKQSGIRQRYKLLNKMTETTKWYSHYNLRYEDSEQDFSAQF